jgi:hypothetical protein
MDLIWILGGLAGISALFWAIVRLEHNHLDEAIKEAQQWDSKQKRMKQALERK